MLDLIIALIILGALLYIVRLLPIDATIKVIINVVAIVLVCVWILRSFGHMGGPFFSR